MKRYALVHLFAILSVLHLAPISQCEAGYDELLKGNMFRSVDNQQSIRIISSDELEITRDRTGPHFVCKYAKENESLRVVATVLGTTQALYFKITDQGLQSDDGTTFYDSAHFDEANHAAALQAEARRKAAVDAAVKASSPTPKALLTAIPIPVMSIGAAAGFAVFAPRPEYPMEARSRHMTGSGVAVLTVNVASGEVTDATMVQSIGSPILDNATISTFRRWRFKPGRVLKVRIPITYTMTGASY